MESKTENTELRTQNNSAGNTEISTANQILQVLLIIGQILWMWVEATYEMLMALYRKIIPIPEKSVQGEIILITGTGHGIGKELALQFASLGATIVCWDINKKNNEQTVKDIAAAGGPKAYAYECDVSNRQAVLDMVQKVKTEVGEITMLVNNAGIMPCHSLLDHTEEEIRKIFDINVFAHFWILKAVLPDMLKNNHGHIIALSSMAGLLGLKNLVPYCASKFAVRGLMEALFEELRETIPNTNIKFTVIYPYMVDTGLCKNPKIKYPWLLSQLPVQQVAKEIVGATLRDTLELTIPSYMLCLNNTLRLFPTKVPLLMKDFLGSGMEPDL